MKRSLLSYARSLGFERVGIALAGPLQKEGDFLKRWLAQGRAGEMSYLEREPERRSRPTELLPGAKSVIALAMNYYVGDSRNSSSPAGAGRGSSHREQSMGSPPRLLACGERRGMPLHPRVAGAPETAGNDGIDGKIAHYAEGKDYHKVMGKRLESFVRYLGSLAPGAECRTFVDTGPLLERGLAQRAGLGFIGKNTMLITKGMGSWVFLASVVSTLELPAEAPDERTCGECRLCIDACPTQAITAPFELDPRRCIAYLTIESERAIPEGLRPKMGGWIFGCDICQEACPHNVRPTETTEPSFRRKPESRALDWAPASAGVTALSDLLSITDEAEFQKRFAGSAIWRSGRVGLLRNACVAAANLGRKDLTPRLLELARSDSSPIVREHAAAALETLV